VEPAAVPTPTSCQEYVSPEPVTFAPDIVAVAPAHIVIDVPVVGAVKLILFSVFTVTAKVLVVVPSPQSLRGVTVILPFCPELPAITLIDIPYGGVDVMVQPVGTVQS
jgi:hypothetical protein